MFGDDVVDSFGGCLLWKVRVEVHDIETNKVSVGGVAGC